MSLTIDLYTYLTTYRLNIRQRGEKLDWLCRNIPHIRRIEGGVRLDAVKYYTHVDQNDGLPNDHDVREEFDVLSWWKDNAVSGDLPNLRRALAVALLYQPSSAAAERVFSLINNYLGKKQMTASDELMKAQVMTQYNNKSFGEDGLNRNHDPSKYTDVWKAVDMFLGQLEAVRRPPQRP